GPPMRRMRHQSRRRRRAFTLIEMIAVMSIMGVLAGVATPLVWSASDAFAAATSTRDAIERCDYALQQMARLLRTEPAASEGESPIVAAHPSRLECAGGARIELIGTTLWLASSGAAAAPL